MGFISRYSLFVMMTFDLSHSARIELIELIELIDCVLPLECDMSGV